MNVAAMTTLDSQRDKLEREIIETKQLIVHIKEGAYPDISKLNQLKDTIERHMQLINMIDQHLYSQRQAQSISRR